MSKLSLSALDKFLRSHKRTCNYYVFSGSRSCSCGRDEAIAELMELREKIEKIRETLPSIVLEACIQ